MAAGVRSVFWFAAFALVEGVPWSDRARARAAVAGVALLLVYLSVADGFGDPAVVQPMLVLAALSVPGTTVTERRSAAAFLPVAGFVAAFLLVAVYFLAAFYPTIRTRGELQEALRDRIRLAKNGAAARREETAKAPDNRDKVKATEAASRWLKQHILGPLVRAAAHDPGDAFMAAELSRWYGELWQLDPDTKEPGTHAVHAAAWGEGGPARAWGIPGGIPVAGAASPGSSPRTHRSNTAWPRRRSGRSWATTPATPASATCWPKPIWKPATRYLGIRRPNGLGSWTGKPCGPTAG